MDNYYKQMLGIYYKQKNAPCYKLDILTRYKAFANQELTFIAFYATFIALITQQTSNSAIGSWWNITNIT